MKNRLFAGLLASVVLGAAFAIPAQAACQDSGNCASFGKAEKRSSVSPKRVKTAEISRKASKTRLAARKVRGATASAVKRRSSHVRTAVAVKAPAAAGGHVVSLIKAMAPSYGVPTWFALRIAKVESNYNPNTRGAAGEYGVYQLKCSTAKGIGFSGNCAALLDARTNIQYGLKHLAIAMKASGGDLRLTASKHNGGLGRRTMVYGYVAKVF